MKISREGVLLIKSFEGFRPRAQLGSDGRWIIGYGHTASARDGAVVSEAEAELLLQYDLIPVQAALSEGLTRPVNQHQYDALASFAFSVGIQAFRASDVLARVNSGSEAGAAEALVAWPEPPVRDAGLRRRSAERALFTADPATAVTLFDLLAAPVLAAPLSSPPEAGPADPPPSVASTDPASTHDSEPPANAGEVPIFAPVLVSADSPPASPTQSDLGTDASLAETSAAPASLVASAITTDADLIAVNPPAGAQVESFAPPAIDAAAVTTGRDDSYATPPAGPIDSGAPEPEAVPAADPFTGAVVPTTPIPGSAPDESAHQGEIAGELRVSGAVAESAALAAPRLVWPNNDSSEERFDDQGRLDLSSEPAAWADPAEPRPAGFSWRRVWAYLVMGGFGLVSLAMSMAALRKASMADTETTSILAIAAVLAAIGAICVGVSAHNIYQRLSDDR